MQTHIVPVGFDYDRLIAPLIRDQFDVDRAILLEGAVGSEANVEYSRNLASKLETDFQSLLGAETDRIRLEDVYDYDTAFEGAFELINEQLDGGAEVWVNVCSMPRPVSFAFATAAHSVMVERQEDRDRIHTYYTAPEKYLETELAEELRAERELLGDLLAADDFDRDRIEERLESTADLLAEFDERGSTIGAKEINGQHIVELPVASFSSVKPFEELILFTLGEHGEFDSVSDGGTRPRSERGVHRQLPIEGDLQRRPPRPWWEGVYRTGGGRQILPNNPLTDRRAVGSLTCRYDPAVSLRGRP